MLPGCAGYVPRPVSAEASAAGFDSRRLTDPGLREALAREGMVAPRSGWSLSHLTAAAHYLNQDLALLRAKARTAEAAIRTAGERPNPSFSFKPGYNSTRTAGVSPWILEPGLDFTIETNGKRASRMAESIARARVAWLEMETGGWKVRGDIRRALLAMHAARITGARFRAQEAAQVEAVGLLEARARDGAATPQEIALARIPLNQTRLSMHDTVMQAAKARGQLAAATGVPAAALAGLEFDFREITRLPAAPPGPEARRRALTRRPDILAALADYAASEARLQLEVRKQYPDIKLGPGYKLDQGPNKWSLGLGFELPVFNQHQGAIAEAEAKRGESAARFLALQARVLAEIDIALDVYRSARAKAEAAGSLADDVRAQTKTAESMKTAGEISLVEVSLRRVEQGAADLARQQAQVQALEAAGALEDALQTPVSLWK